MLGYAISADDVMRWADEHRYKTQSNLEARRFATLQQILQEVPAPRRKFMFVHDEVADDLAYCIVVASNNSQTNLDRARDKECIKLSRKVLGTDAEPKWRQPVEP
jgi:hypothetical protein